MEIASHRCRSFIRRANGCRRRLSVVPGLCWETRTSLYRLRWRRRVVPGSRLGRPTNHDMDDDVDVIPRNSESNIAERASFSLFSSTYSFVFTFRPLRIASFIASSRVPFSSFPFTWLSGILKKNEFDSSFMYPIRLWLKNLSLFLSLFFLFFFFLLIVYFDPLHRCIYFFLFSSSRCRARYQFWNG